MTRDLDAATIASQIARNLTDDYDGFTVDSSDVGASRVPPGEIHLEGFLADDEDVMVEFVVTVSRVEVTR